ncbi:hypothetical protein GpartN1_g3446.t1 [Galdieria partita]|uniref:Uncharacterized protein n=1 Tax=Galdieria partita TaxID=83374 RepID=A0A9C7PWG6_9RHOD|nr:hypothetical protein GpartN1_g3446.t1 [Galdieria partita]
MKLSCHCFVAYIFPFRRSSVYFLNKSTSTSAIGFYRQGKQRTIKAELSFFDFQNKTSEADSVQFGSVRSKLEDVCRLCENIDQDKLADLQRQLHTICEDVEQLDKLYYELYQRYEQAAQSNEKLVKQVDALQRQVKQLEADIVYFRGEY